MIISLLLALLPSFLQTPIRRMLGAHIHKSARIHFGTVLIAKRIELGPHSSLGPFAIIRAETLRVGAHSAIRPFTLCQAGEIELGAYVRVAPTAVISSELAGRSRFAIGDHSRIFPFCWLEPGEGITIGKQTAIGGHTLIFTHGTWPDYLSGGIVTRGPVVIGDNVWIPWRVMVLPNVNIGENAVISAGSVVNRSVPPSALAAGVPARIAQGFTARQLSAPEREVRLRRIMTEFAERLSQNMAHAQVTSKGLQFSSTIAIDVPTQLVRGDLLFLLNRSIPPADLQSLLEQGVSVLDHNSLQILIASTQPYIPEFVQFLRRYGIRLYVHHFSAK